MRVKNKQILRKITWRSLKAGRFRNIIAIFAIMLTTVMFTAVATLGSAMMQATEENTFRQVGTSAHGGYKYLTQEQYDRVAQSTRFQDISYNIVLGFAVNPELAERQHEVRFSEDKQAEWGFTYPSLGAMPKDYKDIVLADITLDLLNLPHELGQMVHLDININNGEIISDDFILSGIYEGDAVMWASQIYLSHDYVRDLAPSPEKVDLANPTGLIDASVWLGSALNIEAKLNDALTECGFDTESMYPAVNWGYISSGELDPTAVVLVVSMVLIITVSGYLIIYSVFAISVSGDIRFYGLLKTIGTTGRQIRGIVYRQALLLSAAGIPLGLFFGFLLGTKLAPIMMDVMSFDLTSPIKANPLIFVIAAIFSLITIFISCRKPGKMAAKVSPVEALRYTEGNPTGGKGERRGRRVSPFSMAAANIGRSKRKLVTVLLSLSLSLVLLNSVVSIVNSFDMDAYLSNQLLSDVYFTDSGRYNHAVSPFEKDFQAISQELIDETSVNPNVDEYGRVFFSDAIHTITDANRLARMDEIIRPYLKPDYGLEELEYTLEEGFISVQIYGLDRLGFEAISSNFQGVTWEEFSAGHHALIETFNYENEPENSLYEIGEMIPLEADDGSITEYGVLGYMAYPHAMSGQYTSLIGFRLAISAEEFETLFPEHQPMSLMVNANDSASDALETWALDLISGVFPDLTCRTKAFYLDEFQGLQNIFLILGGVLATILALVGILNFVNTMATSIMTRRRELAMLQSVGMTGKQLRQMLFGEGLWYALLTLAFVLTIGSALSALLANGIAREIWFFSYQFSITPVLICAPILLVLCAVIPLLCAKVLQKESVVERLREN